MITCPKKDCLSDIDNDSVYCDQCGSELKECPKCGDIYISNFCIKDGSKTIKRIIPANIQAPAVKPENAGGATIRYQLAAKLELTGIEEGINLSIESGDIIGREYGKHSSVLSKYNFISGRHAEFKYVNNQWLITDLNSTNFTFINGNKLLPLSAGKINDGDIIKLADKSFKVNII